MHGRTAGEIGALIATSILEWCLLQVFHLYSIAMASAKLGALVVEDRGIKEF